MPAVSESQQRLFGMVHAYQKGKLKHAPGKIRQIARHISEEDAEHFARTKHDGLPERKKKETEKDAASSQPVIVTIGRNRKFKFPSLKAAVIWLANLPGISNAEARGALNARASGIKAIKLQYPPAQGR